MMLGFGLATDKTQGYLQTLGDISMGNSEKLMSLTRAFSQIGASWEKQQCKILTK